MSTDLPVVLITGASSGIGLETAVAAARAGSFVVATMRDTGRDAALRAAARDAGVAERIEVRRLDVTDQDAARECVAAVVADHGRLDGLVNNAGAGRVGTLEIDGTAKAREVMEVNFFGALHTTEAAMPHLRASGGRLVTVTSVGGVIGQPFNEAYCAAKFALEGFMEALHPVAARVGVSVSVVEPGAVASEFVRNAGAEDIPARIAEAGPYAEAMQAYLDRTRKSFAAAQSAADAGATVAALLTGDRPAFRVQTSEAARAFISPKLADLDGGTVTGLTAGWVA
ncbi:SDR family NAD(P)-dependent oxidoreductase [Kitasatospora sp. NPDC059571]|uniref:SDR family NAD(P)-dependent oxidoreductase n=1 Tax=Kitasatospora sp. NPDC059571 TaxID=3346871 RepID=UPI0036C6A192